MPISYWMDLFFHTHSVSNHMARFEWPNGRSYLQQSNLLIEVFDVMKDESLIRLREQKKRESNRRGR